MNNEFDEIDNSHNCNWFESNIGVAANVVDNSEGYGSIENHYVYVHDNGLPNTEPFKFPSFDHVWKKPSHTFLNEKFVLPMIPAQPEPTTLIDEKFVNTCCGGKYAQPGEVCCPLCPESEQRNKDHKDLIQKMCDEIIDHNKKINEKSSKDNWGELLKKLGVTYNPVTFHQSEDMAHSFVEKINHIKYAYITYILPFLEELQKNPELKYVSIPNRKYIIDEIFVQMERAFNEVVK